MFFSFSLGTFKTASKRIPDAIKGLELQATTDAENSGRGKRLFWRTQIFASIGSKFEQATSNRRSPMNLFRRETKRFRKIYITKK